MAEYYKFEIANWNEGTANLTLEQEAAYLRVVNAIRLSDQPITYNLFVLCGLWRCNERKAKRILNELVDAGKVRIDGGKIVNDKAVEAAENLRGLREDRASAGRLGGIKSGKSRRKAAEEKATEPQENDARPAVDQPSTSRPQAVGAASVSGRREFDGQFSYPNSLKNIGPCEAIASTREEKRREENIGGGGSACAREADQDRQEPPPAVNDPTPREQVLEAMGIGPDGVAGPSRFLGGQGDVAELGRWLELPGMTLEFVCEEVRRVAAAKADGPPSSFRYFTPAMQRLSGALSAPKLEPSAVPGARVAPQNPDLGAIFAKLEAEDQHEENT